tara:strand:- start:629 stop:1261 length:633 start_codon:yes stop_codon:yes gene_type:complete
MPRLQRVPEPHVQYAYGVYLLGHKHPLIKALKSRHQPSIHGHRSWESAYLMMDYLVHNPIDKGGSVMELGCGWGAVATFCAKEFEAAVTAVDMDAQVFPYLGVVAEINGVQIETKCGDFTKLKGPELGANKVVVGSDICFWDSLVEPLVRLVGRAMKAGTEKIIIADPGRPTFYEFCDRVAQLYPLQLQEWYSVEPDKFTGEVVEIRNKK